MQRELIKGRLGGKEFIYNPTSISETRGALYREINSPGLSYPLVAYSGGQTSKIEFELYLNGRAMIQGEYRTDEEGADFVQEWIDHLTSFLPTPGTQFRPPPVLEYAFGPRVERTRLESMDPIEYLAFTPNLKPLEVVIPITLIVLK